MLYNLTNIRSQYALYHFLFAEPEGVCNEACLLLAPTATQLVWFCSSTKSGETCSVDQIQFFGSGARKLNSNIVKRVGNLAPTVTPSKAPTTQSKAPVPKQVSQPSPRSKAPTPQATWNRFTYKKKKKLKTEEASSSTPQESQPPTGRRSSATASSKPQESLEPEEEPITFEDIFAKLSKEEEMICNKKTFRFGLRDNCSSDDDDENDNYNCCMDSTTKEVGCGLCSSCNGLGQIVNGRDTLGSTCCDSSAVLAEDPSVRCFEPESGRKNYDHCCKSTNQVGSNNANDFYCFRDKGSNIGNFAYCLTIADTPPHQYTRKPPPKQPKKLRSQYAKRMKNRDDKIIIFLVLSLIGMFVVMLWRKSIKAARLNSVRNDDEDEEDFPVLII